MFFDIDSYDKADGLLSDLTVTQLVGERKTVNIPQMFLIFPTTF
ncbi:hypothetical protein [Candidatus Albibeggiatoa sp. nov. BB20]